MNRPQLGIVKTGVEPLPPPREAGGRGAAMAIALGTALAAAGAISWAGHQALGAFLSDLDGRTLVRASTLLERTLEEQRADLLSEVRVLGDDTRVRATVMTPEFNEATVKDVLDDLQKAAGASILAVLDVNGKVQAVTGADNLRGVDLGSAPVVRQAMDAAAAQVWTFGDQVLVVALAPVKAGDRTAALFMMGYEVGARTLASIERGSGAQGVVLIRDRVAASSNGDNALAQAARAAAGLAEDRNHVLRSPHDGRELMARVSATGESAGAGKVVWLVPRHEYGPRVKTLQILVFAPIPLGALAFALAFSALRRRASPAAS